MKSWSFHLFTVLVTTALLLRLSAQPTAARSQRSPADCVVPPAGLVSWWPGDGDARPVAQP